MAAVSAAIAVQDGLWRRLCRTTPIVPGQPDRQGKMKQLLFVFLGGITSILSVNGQNDVARGGGGGVLTDAEEEERRRHSNLYADRPR